MEMTQMADLLSPCPGLAEVAAKLTGHLNTQLALKDSLS
jgi:lipoyl(octanoyl) transferase